MPSAVKKRVLIVDDSSYVRNTLKAILEKSPKFDVVGFAHDGLEAISKCKELKPDIVAMDLIMPRMDGMQALRILKSMNANLKVVMVTSMNAMDKIVECKTLGASHYIIKPLEEKEVLCVFLKL